MLIPRSVLGIVMVGLAALGASAVFGQATSTGSGQAYPNKPIRIIANEPGGGNDLTARLIAQGISGPLGQAVIVDNRTALIGTETTAKAPPDGYTLFTAGNSLWLLPFLRDNLSWDPVKDFSPITMATMAPLTLVVNSALPVKSVKELIALAKARPGELNWGMGTTGIPTHLAPKFFNVMAGVNIMGIQYKSGIGGLTGILVGEVQMMYVSAPTASLNVKSGKLRALAVTSAKPSPLLPGLPSVAESGLPGYEITQLVGIVTAGKTPAAVIRRLNQEIVRVLNRTDTKEKLFNVGAEVVANSPEQFAATIKSEMARMGKLIKDAGIKVE